MRKLSVCIALMTAASFSGLLSVSTLAEQQAPVSHADWDSVEFSHVKISDGLYVLFGDGGNVGVSVGEDGIYLIDDESKPLSDKMLAEIGKITGETDPSVRFVLNTHWHYDHAGGNEALGGKGAVIIAHDNTRTRLVEGLTYPGFDVTVDPTAPVGLPVLTFSSESSLHLNGTEARAIHVPNAHTDGDVIIHFPALNVIHAGDAFLNGGYPVVDAFSGGSIDGMIAAQQKIAELANDETIIIPGHGALASKADVERMIGIISEVRDRVAVLKAGGATMDEVIAAAPSAEWDAEFGALIASPPLLIMTIYMTVPTDGAAPAGE